MGKPKYKTRKAAAKRFKVTASGKIMRYKAGKKHILEHKSRATLRHMGNKAEVSPSDKKNIRQMLGI